MLKSNLGSIVVSLQHPELTLEEQIILTHKSIGGVILFTRNFSNKQQLIKLISSIRKINEDIIIMVDQEGGKVWRFKHKEFKNPGPMCNLGRIYNHDPNKALFEAYRIGQEIATDLIACGIDLNLAPVLDLDHNNISTVIGDRAIHHDPIIVAKIAAEFIKGQQSVGMPSIGKHFPGHGAIKADTHFTTAIDNRNKSDIFNLDLEVFKLLIMGDPKLNILPNTLHGIMPAHVIYSEVDRVNPAGFSKIWLQDVLRDYLNFTGIIISDCLSMKASQEFISNKLQNTSHKILKFKDLKITNSKQVNNLIATKEALDAGCDLVIFNGLYNQDLLNLLDNLELINRKIPQTY